jgi:hypothetical protein
MEGFTFLFEDAEECDDDAPDQMSWVFIPEELFMSFDDLRFWWLCADARDLTKNPFTEDIVLEGIRNAIHAKPRNYSDEVCFDFVESLGMTPEEVIEKARVEAGDGDGGITP